MSKRIRKNRNQESDRRQERESERYVDNSECLRESILKEQERTRWKEMEIVREIG